MVPTKKSTTSIKSQPCTWPLHGRYMAVTWPSHGRLSHGRYMAVTWPSHGRYMAVTWPCIGEGDRVLGRVESIYTYVARMHAPWDLRGAALTWVISQHTLHCLPHPHAVDQSTFRTRGARLIACLLLRA